MATTFEGFRHDLLRGDYAVGFQEGYDARLAVADQLHLQPRHYNKFFLDTQPVLYKAFMHGWYAGDEYVQDFWQQWKGRSK